MIGRRQWRGGARVALQGALFVLCLLTVACVRRLVTDDTLSVFGDLALNGTALLVLGSAAAMAGVLALSPASGAWAFRRGRVGLCAIPVGLILLGALFVKASYCDVSIELESLVRASEPPDPETVIAVGPGGADVRLSGALVAGAAARLEALLAGHPSVTRIHLTSEGGLADEGQAIGDVIAAHGLTTYVPDFCVSACTLAFVRGRERLVLANARVGFHAPFEEGLFGTEIEDDSSAQRQAYLVAGVDPAFVNDALATPAADLWIPPPERLIAAHVATAIVDSYRFPDSNLDGDATPAAARALVLRNFRILAPFEARAPAVVDRVAAWYLDAYRAGLSEGEALDGLRRAVSLAASAVLADADDATLARAARTFAEAMAAARAPGDCLAIAASGDAVTAASYLDRSRSTTRLVDLLDAALAHPGSREGAAGAARGLALRASTCEQALAAYAAVLRRPDAEVAFFMRQILGDARGMEVAQRTSPITRTSMTTAP